MLGNDFLILNGKRTFSILASCFSGKGDSFRQNSQLSFDSGSISKCNAIDDSKGVITFRIDFNASLSKPTDEKAFVKANTFYLKCQFE
jgi:hypothetical protein